jgi:CheY-like chemotaxis protein
MSYTNTQSHAVTHEIPIAPETSPRRGAILVVEDRDDVRDGMAQLLELHGFLVVDAAEAEQAWGHLNADPSGFALILLDLNLPGVLDGTGLRGRQLAYPRLREIPTIVVSAAVPDDDNRTLHADAWISKPYRFEDLLAVVKQYVTPEASALLAD